MKLNWAVTAFCAAFTFVFLEAVKITWDNHHKLEDIKFGVTCFDHNITIEAYKYEYGAGGCAKFYSTKTVYQPSVLICGCNVIVPEEKK